MERGEDEKLFDALVGFADLGDTEAVPGGVPKDISDRQRAFGRNQSHSIPLSTRKVTSTLHKYSILRDT